MIHVHGLTKHYADLRRGQLVALGGISFHARPGQIYGLLGPERGRQDDRVAHPQHGVASDRRRRHDQRLRRGHAALAGAAPDRLPVGQHGGLRSHDRLGDGRVFRPPLPHPRGRVEGADGSALPAAEDERLPRSAGGEDVDRHEAEGVGGPGPGPRSARAHFRRAHRRPGRAGRPGVAGHHRPLARSRQVHHLLHPHHARGRAALRPPGDPAPRPNPGGGDAGGVARTASAARPGGAVLPVDLAARRELHPR